MERSTPCFSGWKKSGVPQVLFEGQRAGAFAKHRASVGLEMGADIFGRGIIAGLDAKTLERTFAKAARGFIAAVHHQKMVARRAYRKDGQSHRLDARGDRDGSGRAFNT
jgi:hypothetical protein